MKVCAEKFTSKLDSENLTYDVLDDNEERTVIAFPYDGKRTLFFFEEDDGSYYVKMRTYVEEGIAEDKYGQAVLMANLLNCDYRWVKFCVTKDNDFIVDQDAILDPNSAGEECFEMLIRNVHIIKDARPHIMKAIFG